MTKLTDEQRINAAKVRYSEAAHAMQTGVRTQIMEEPVWPAHEQENGKAGVSRKALRVGINAAMVEASMLGKLMVDKGIITWVEYYEALAEAMVAEKVRFEKELSEHFGQPASLG